jgi:hypothetical protein
MVTAYEQTASVKDDLAYDHWKRKSAGWMAKKNIKGFTEQAEAIEFIERKEKREQRAIDHIETMLDADEWSPATGYDLGLEHPLAR